jgi:predicted outer membrane repeat protein
MKKGGTMKFRCGNIFMIGCLILALIGLVSNVGTADTEVSTCDQTNLQNAASAGGTVTFNCGPTATINLTSPIIIQSSVTIDGGGNKIVIDGGGSGRLFEVTGYYTLGLIGLTLQKGSVDGDGGAIWSNGPQVTITNSTLAHNYAKGSGGAIRAGNTTLYNSTVTENTADADGGAIWVADNSLLRLNRSTISYNTAGGKAGGVFFTGYYNSSLIWYDSILAGNTASSYEDCYDNGFYYSPVSLYSILGSSRCGISGATNIVDVDDPMLGPLADNGGPTPTMLPLSGSPAIHNGNPDGYSGWGDIGLVDQRGFPRDFPYDIGAVELGDTTPPEIKYTVEGTLGKNGWYISDVTVSWELMETESEITSKSGCDPVTLIKDTAGTTLSCTATSKGGTNSSSVTIKRDATPPTATAIAGPPANQYGWRKQNVTVTFSGTDNLSGGVTCDPQKILSSEGSGQSASGSCYDAAGNKSLPFSVSGINIDKTAPLIEITSPVNGWTYFRNQPVDAGFSCSDSLSTIADCKGTVNNGQPIDTSKKTKNAKFTVTATDKAGNTTKTTVSYSVQ